MKKIFLIIGFPTALFIISSASSCKPGTTKPFPQLAKCDSANTVRFPKDATEKFYFKDSSYWIYQDSLSKQIDSVWVAESVHEVFNKFHNKELHEKCYEGFIYATFSSLHGRTRVLLQPNSVGDERAYKDEYFQIDYLPEENHYSPIFRFFLRGNDYLPNQEEGVLSTINGFKVNSISYDVLHLSNPQDNADIYKDAYYASEIGLVKYRLKNGSVWELVKYKIKK